MDSTMLPAVVANKVFRNFVRTRFDIEDDFDSAGFFSAQPRIAWHDRFSDILARAMVVQAGTSYEIGCLDFADDLDDFWLDSIFVNGQFFDETSVCISIASFIHRQFASSNGLLLTNGFGNLFCIRSFTINVWSESGERWNIVPVERSGLVWSEGCRMFFLIQ